MKYDFTRNTKTIKEVYRDFDEGRLVIDRTYQRRKVWNNEDKVRLIETILMGLVMPEVFFWAQSTDPETGYSPIHVVDGQQRITTITDFILGDFQLTEKYLLDTNMKKVYGNKDFKQLDDDSKKTIWNYPISIVNIDTDCSIDIVKTMFYRLNLTNYSLNQQEKRNSKDSVFGDKSESLSTLNFWATKRIFSAADAKRMKDVEYCCSIFILANEGIVDQTNGKKINDYYDDYSEDFDPDNTLEKKIHAAMKIIDNLTDKQTIQFISKKAQLYTTFCMVFKMMDNGIDFSNDIFEKFKLFVIAYSSFRNESSIECENALEQKIYESIKKYKLASSEGINKVNNRVIRFQELYENCVNSNNEIKTTLKSLIGKLKYQLTSKDETVDAFEKDDMVDLSETD
ncbi:MAG: DUF262 domain-containing protein [Turicibacter sp.]|nr:DUF262 domain-containing protein [Turicibacter sp.]